MSRIEMNCSLALLLFRVAGICALVILCAGMIFTGIPRRNAGLENGAERKILLDDLSKESRIEATVPPEILQTRFHNVFPINLTKVNDSFYNDVYMRLDDFKRKIDPDYKKRKILVLAYARSGSSFTGDLISAPNSAAYWYEPLRVFTKPDGQKFEAEDEEPKLAEDFIKGLFDCDETVMNKTLNRGSDRKNTHKCKASDPVVIKTIRLHSKSLEPWIYDSSDITVLHLVRDPRGMLNSMSKRTDIWGPETWRHHQELCQEVMDDLRVGGNMPTGRYIRVRYEDLVENTFSEIKRLYSFLGLPFNRDAAQTIYEHVNPEEDKKKTNAKYFSTYRNEDFDHNSWMKTLDIDSIRDIESACSELMAFLGYSTFEENS